MASACGVTWDGTASGKLDEAQIPDAPDHKSHYINAAETKGDSSFPVVDGDGRLRAGNVNSAWDLRGSGEEVSEQCLRNLDDAFEDNVLPDSAYENSDMTITIGDNDVDGKFGMNLSFTSLPADVLGEDFNEYGVRENEDGSLDVRFKAMEPGVRKGVEITEEFLDDVSSRDYGRIPIQLDHSDSQRANVGYTRPGNIQFNGEYLTTEIHVPNTGSSVRDDIIADFTHDPPQVQDISVAFDPRSMEVEKPSKRGENARFTSGRIREFSLTPFPAGYDNGGLTPEFSAAVEQAVIGPDETEEPESQLITRPHTLIRNYD